MNDSLPPSPAALHSTHTLPHDKGDHSCPYSSQPLGEWALQAHLPGGQQELLEKVELDLEQQEWLGWQLEGNLDQQPRSSQLLQSLPKQ